MADPFRVISWGCGVQSTTLAVMSALGELPSVDAVINADTGWERQATCEARDFYAGWLRERGATVEIVDNGSIRDNPMAEHRHIPLWTDPRGKSPLKRQCTPWYKVTPCKRRARERMGFHKTKPPHPKVAACEMWIGFSLDELTRVKQNPIKFMENRFPLIEQHMTRGDCEKYLEHHGLPIPVKSACVICPYRVASDWMIMRNDCRSEFEDAIDFDESIRYYPRDHPKLKRETAFIYRYGGPLKDADLEGDAARERSKEAFQLPLLCESGYCWT